MPRWILPCRKRVETWKRPDQLSLPKLKEDDLNEDDSKKDTQTQLLDSPDTKSQQIPPRPVPLAAPQSALAEMRFRNLIANSGVKQPATPTKEYWIGQMITDRKWIAIGAIAILAALLAFLVGWILGDPSRMKLGHLARTIDGIQTLKIVCSPRFLMQR